MLGWGEENPIKGGGGGGVGGITPYCFIIIIIIIIIKYLYSANILKVQKRFTVRGIKNT